MSYQSDYFCIYDVPVTANGTTTTSNYVSFYTLAEDGGLAIEENSGFLLSQIGPAFFSGITSDPMFQTGTVNLTNFGFMVSTFPGNFTVTIVPTPEPCSFALLGTGLLGAAGALKRRFPSFVAS